MVLEHDLNIDAVLLGGVDDLVPPLRYFQIDRARIDILARYPIQILAIEVAHPDSGPILARLAHLLQA